MKVKEFRTSNNAIELNHSIMIESDKESKVEKSGYIPAKKRIENMMLAGQRLVASRNQLYDDPTGMDEDIPIDRTRNPGYDMADASQDMMSVNERLKASQKAAEDAARSKEKAQEEPKKDTLTR